MVTDILKLLKRDYPDLIFKPGKKFLFHPPRTILFNNDEPNFNSLLLHELSHAILQHHDFKTDLERVKMESEAWEKAGDLAKKYDLEIDPNFINEELDSYRNWLHTKSKCKACGLTRYQTPDGIYHCPKCDNF